MGIVVSSTDFVNEFQLSQNPKFVPLIDDVIANNERRLILELFGATMGAEIITEINADSVQAKYQVLIDAIELDIDNCGKIILSEGLAVYLKCKIRFLVIREAAVKNMPIGALTTVGENATTISPVTEQSRMWTRAADTGYNIHQYIHYNPEGYDYSTFNGENQRETVFTW